MSGFTYDIVLLTQEKFVQPAVKDWYIDQVMTEDRLVKQALENLGLKVYRTNWDNQKFDWKSTRYVLFRSIWDYFHRIEEFIPWLNRTSKLCGMINSYETIIQNADKHYLEELRQNGLNIPNTIFIESKDHRSLAEICSKLEWSEFVLKPAVGGAGRHTYRFDRDSVSNYADIFSSLLETESMLIQEFQHQIITKGEITLVLFGGKYSHAVIKTAKSGDFRVQDDFGGSVKAYTPSHDEIEFAETVMAKVKPLPLYGRVDIMWDNNNELCVSELELIEPELWFRLDDEASHRLAAVVYDQICLIDQ